MWQLTTSEERFFSEQQHKQVDALFEAILPGDDEAPGAKDAKAAEYLDRFLAMDESFYYEIRDWKKMYLAGLPALDAASTQMYGGRGLLQLSADEVTDILLHLSQGTLSGVTSDLDQKGFFNLLRNHCIEGCFADPRWGGNDRAIIWRWYGYLQDARDFKRDNTGTLQEVR